MLRLCVKCKIPKPLDEFHVQKLGLDGRRRDCKFCKNKQRNSTRDKKLSNEQSKKWNNDNRDRRLEYKKVNYRRNIEMTKIWREKNIEKCRVISREYVKMRRHNDPVFNLANKMRTRLATVLRDYHSDRASSVKIVGCSYQELNKYLEETFFKNYGVIFDKLKHEVQVDHIIPLSSANNLEDVIRLSHYTNLQYLLKVDNLRKSNKMNYTLTILEE